MSHELAYRLHQLATTKHRKGLLPVSPATIWRWVNEGRFPKPYTMGKRCTVWPAAAIDEWLKQQQSGGLNDA